MIHSCGAVLYTIKNNRVYIVLGKEGYDYFHFKGCCKPDETYEQTAIREIYEETMGLVKLNNITLHCSNIKSKKKIYHLGLVKVQSNIVEQFIYLKNKYKDIVLQEFNEKEDIKLFSFSKILSYNLHVLTLKPILYYYNILENIQNNLIYMLKKSKIITRNIQKPVEKYKCKKLISKNNIKHHLFA